jgi:hypothetical protein
MRVLVAFESMWGNTEEVARAVARGIGGSGAGNGAGDVECRDVAADVPASVDGVQLLVVGGPTHAFSMSRTGTRHDAVGRGGRQGHEERGIREWLESLPASDQVRVATFDTRVDKVRRLPGSAARAAAKQARRHHLGTLVATESFYVVDTPGPLLDGELERAEAWGSELARAAAGGAG